MPARCRHASTEANGKPAAYPYPTRGVLMHASSVVAATSVAAGKSFSVSVWFKTTQTNGTVFTAATKPMNRNAPAARARMRSGVRA